MSNKNQSALQDIPDGVVYEYGERLIDTMSSLPQKREFMTMEYIIMLTGVPAVDEAMAEAYAEASVANDKYDTPIPAYLVDAHSGYGVVHINPAVLRAVLECRLVASEVDPYAEMLIVLSTLAGRKKVIEGVQADAAYADVAVIFHVYTRKTEGGDNLLVVEAVRKGGCTLEHHPLQNRYTIRQCDAMEDTVEDNGKCQHMIIPEEWYPLSTPSATFKWGHYEIPRALPININWGHDK